MPMANPSTRGTAPGRTQPAHLRPGSFKPGHKKLGGRKHGTPNLFSPDYKRAIFEAAYRIGYDGNGKDGAIGYFCWLRQRHPRIYFSFWLATTIWLEKAGSGAREEPPLTSEERDRAFRDYIRVDDTAKTREAQSETPSPVGWTGQPMPVGGLMQLAVENPKAFCRLFLASILPRIKRSQPALLSGRKHRTGG
jgi:hypothetical protein